MTKRLFRQNHPVLFGLIVLGTIFTIFWGGIAFFAFKAFTSNSSDIFTHKDGIGVIQLQGVILRSEQMIADLTEFRNNENVKAVLVRIDSPGGAVGASQEIYDEIRRTAKVKPIVASLASVAASGGYYAALGADKIFANPGTLTGSIGVIMKFANLKQIMDKVGYKTEIVKSGKHKDIGSMERTLTEEERQLLQELIDSVHQQFIMAVADSRHLEQSEVAKFADGRIFTGSQAKDLGLIDNLGNFTTAIETAAELAGISTDNPHLIYPEEEDFQILKLLTSQNAKSALELIWPAKTPQLSYEWSLSK